VLGGLDAFVFTAGIGENSAPLRAVLCGKLTWLGVKLDERANAYGGPRVSAPDTDVSVWGHRHQRGADDRPAHAGARTPLAG
jgi:acetate kinase